MLMIFSPHTGQSSQLVVDAKGRNAQFLPTVVRSALIRKSIFNNAPVICSPNSRHILFTVAEYAALRVVYPQVLSSGLITTLTSFVHEPKIRSHGGINAVHDLIR